MLIPGEMYPTKRLQADKVEGTPMENLEHLGQYVFEMTQAKLKAIGDVDVVIPTEFPDDVEEMDEDEVMIGGADDDEDLTVQQHV